MQEYIGLIKIEQNQEYKQQLDSRADPNLNRYLQLHKQIQGVLDVIDLRVNMLLNSDDRGLETQQHPIHRFLLIQPNKF